MITFLNRELSWLKFNHRVLCQAIDKQTPILEKLFFLSIYESNLDEFMMVRMGNLIDQSILKPLNKDYLDEIEQILVWVKRHNRFVKQVYQQVVDELNRIDVVVTSMADLSKAKQHEMKEIFLYEIKPLLSTQIIDRFHPFPFIHNQENVVMFELEQEQFALVSMTNIQPVICLREKEKTFILFVDEVIKFFSQELFKKQKILQSTSLRVIRNADLHFAKKQEQEDEDFVQTMTTLLRKRKRQSVVLLELSNMVNVTFVRLLTKKLKLSKNQIVIKNSLVDMHWLLKLKQLLKTEHMEHIFTPPRPFNLFDFNEVKMISALQHQDLLLSYPYHSPQMFVQLLYEAAIHPDVTTIRITLYRVAPVSKIINALSYAASQGKQVVCVMELRARFDEQSNIEFARILQESGCQVIYGLQDYKVHSKACIIQMKPNRKLKSITYLGTGNFNEITQTQYTDLALLTCHEGIYQDTLEMFEHLALDLPFNASEWLWLAPNHYKQSLIARIDEQILLKEEGLIQIKCNSLNDVDIIEKLVQAAFAGVRVECIIRGICCLYPVNENMKIKSILGRYLEHSRIFRFGQKNPLVYIGSGDLLYRNTERRVEAFVQLLDPKLVEQCVELLNVQMSDESKGWLLQSDGSYQLIDGQDAQQVVAEIFTDAKFYDNIGSEIKQKIKAEKGWFRRFWKWLKGN